MRATRSRLAALAVTAVALCALPMSIGASPAGAATASAVTVTVDRISPFGPQRTSTTKPIRFDLTLTNTTSTALSGVRITAQRGEPTTNQQGLEAVTLAPPASAMGDGLDIAPTRTVTTYLPADSSVQVSFNTTIGIPQDGGICQCADAIYPIYFSASTLTGGQSNIVGIGGTYLPIAQDFVNQVKVGWIWPLIDRPHRLFDTAQFTDDELASEVADGGRLDRALQVVEGVAPTVPLTLVVDPELIDELAVMASGSYSVPSGTDGSTPGTGASVAAAWLARLHQVLASDDDVELELTPYADPDIQSLVPQGRRWRTSMPSEMQARVAHALEGGTASTALTWPAGGRLTADTVHALAERGTRALVLDAAGVDTSTSDSSAPPGAATLHVGSTTLPAVLTSSRLTGLVSSAVSLGGSGLRALPRLLAEVSVRETEDQSGDSTAVLAAPRYVDPDVTAAEETITATASSTYTTGVPLDDVLAQAGDRYASLRGSVPSSLGLSAGTLDAVHALAGSTRTIRSLLTPPDTTGSASRQPGSTRATALLAALPVALQRIESSAWRPSGGLSAQQGARFADRMSGFVDRVLSGVRIVPPSSGSGSYTLTSGTSALPITVVNQLSFPVTVNVRLETVGGLTGLNAGVLESRQIRAGSTVILHVPASAERSGRIKVDAYLSTTDGAQLGAPVSLTVRTTALGSLGIIIMSVAGGLLVLALGRRWYLSGTRRRTRSKNPLQPPPVSMPAEAAAHE